MRVTHHMLVENQIYYSTESLEKLNQLQEKVSSGKEFSSASDNPSEAVAALTIRSTLEKHEAYIDTGNTMDGWLMATDSALASIESMLGRAINLTLDGTSDTMGTDERIALGKEIDIILKQAVDAGNTKHQDEFLFAGFQTNTQPFTLVVGPPDSVTYNGNATTVEDIQRNIGPEQAMTINVDGKILHDPANPNASIFNALIRARDGLTTDNRAEIEAGLADLQNVMETIKTKHTEIGARQREVQAALQGMEKTKIELQGLLSKKEDANMAEAISNLSQQETVYKTVLEVGSRALSIMSLFDYMR
jgi:flagellar hook-associated protein 3 FlgL